MTQEEYLNYFEQESREEVELTRLKNQDYSHKGDALHNLKAIEYLSGGTISLEVGVVVRLVDKFSRTINLLKKEPAVTAEKITDTLRDLSVYAKMLRIYLLHEKQLKQQEEPGGCIK